MISAVLNGTLDAVDFTEEPFFGLYIPDRCAGVPTEILNPKNMWADKSEYDLFAAKLSIAFAKNFSEFEAYASAEILAAVPKAVENMA